MVSAILHPHLLSVHALVLWYVHTLPLLSKPTFLVVVRLMLYWARLWPSSFYQAWTLSRGLLAWWLSSSPRSRWERRGGSYLRAQNWFKMANITCWQLKVWWWLQYMISFTSKENKIDVFIINFFGFLSLIIEANCYFISTTDPFGLIFYHCIHHWHHRSMLFKRSGIIWCMSRGHQEKHPADIVQPAEQSVCY